MATWLIVSLNRSSNNVRVAAIQMNSGPDVAANLELAGSLLAEAASDGCGLAVLPENFALMPERGKDKARHAEEPGDGPIQAFLSGEAAKHGLWIISGSMPMVSPAIDEDRVYGACPVFDAQGQQQALYRKIHLFDVDLADGTKLCESAMVEAGSETVLAQTVAGPLGMSICYDIRFAGLYRELVDAGAKILTVPAAFTLMTGKDHWEVLLRARAIEQQSYVLASAQVGTHVFVDGSGTRQSWGHAMIIDPWGTVLAQCGAGAGVAVANIDLAEVDRVRRQLPALRHRRR